LMRVAEPGVSARSSPSALTAATLTKNESAAGRRTVTLPAAVVAALAEHLADYTAPSPDAFVFLSSQGRHLRRSNFNRRVWCQWPG